MVMPEISVLTSVGSIQFVNCNKCVTVTGVKWLTAFNSDVKWIKMHTVHIRKERFLWENASLFVFVRVREHSLGLTGTGKIKDEAGSIQRNKIGEERDRNSRAGRKGKR